jgi:UDP-N-acetylmuramoylalanine--D-glutamate ligase
MSVLSSAAKTLVVGLGKTGLSCARYLRSQGILTAVTDSRANPPGLQVLRDEMPEVGIFVGGFEPEVFAAAGRLVVSPGVPIAEPLIQQAVARGIEVIGDVELFARAARAPICAITGSNGKSTVTTLVGEMAIAAGLRAAIGGNLGEPALGLLNDSVELYVLELSSFQLETTFGLRAEVATVLNVSADHMDRYPDLDTYAQTKGRIYREARTAVVNRDDPIASALPRKGSIEIGFTLGTPMGQDFGVCVDDGVRWICRGTQRLMPASEVRIAGLHNLANALAALALASACGLPVMQACDVLRRFGGLRHRSELVAERDGIRWYDDSKGTNPGATVAALEGLVPPGSPGRAILIAGGDGKGADFAPLLPAVKRAARAVILIGRDAQLIARALDGQVPLVQAATLQDAVVQAAALAQPGDTVLLSPACASFDMFESYEHRGRIFAEAVGGLGE